MTKTVEPMLPEKFTPEADCKTSVFGQVVATISACLIALSAGTTLSWSSPCLPELEDRNSTTSFHITADEASWTGSLIAIGALISAVPAGFCADKFGRKNSILSLAIFFILSWGFIIKATSVYMLYVGRLLAGLGTGATFVLVPIYIAEIAEDRFRGPLCSCFPLFLCSGIVVTFIVALFAKFVLLSTILAIFPVIFCFSFVFMPETPGFLLKTGKDKIARKSLKYLRGKQAEVGTILADIKKNVNNAKVEKASFVDIIKNRYYFKCLLACCVLFLFQQFSGINAVIFYTVPIFKASQSTLNPIFSSIIVSSIQVFVTILIIFIVDKQGRKTFILQSSIVNCLSLATLASSFHLLHYNVSVPGLNLVPLLSLVIYIFSFSMGMGPIPWIIVGELLSPEIVGTVSGVAIMVNWLSGFVVTRSFGPMMMFWGPYVTFYIFSVLNGLCVVCVYFLVPETKGRSNQDIQSKW